MHLLVSRFSRRRKQGGSKIRTAEDTKASSSTCTYVFIAFLICITALLLFHNKLSHKVVDIHKARGALLGSILADSHALGPHWVYDSNKILERIGKVTELTAPITNYHPGKEAGDLTHYGDQTLWLLKSLAENGGKFSLSAYSKIWFSIMKDKDYQGYKDKASKATIENHEKGAEIDNIGSRSEDLSAAGRIAPLVYSYRNSNEEELVKASISQCKFTHNNAEVILITEFIARASFRVIHGQTPSSALRQVADEKFKTSNISSLIESGLSSKEENTLDAITKFGKSCSHKSGLPSVLHLVTKYEDSYETALMENAAAGGDSAARGLIVGLLIGGHLTDKAIPERWTTSLKSKAQIDEYLSKLTPSHT